MATREARLAEFSQASPKENRPLQILCEDKSGTYIIPYPCLWSDGAWRKVGSTKTMSNRRRLAHGATILAIRRAHVRYLHKADIAVGPSLARHYLDDSGSQCRRP